MKYKVYYKDTEVASFNVLYNAVVYIMEQLDNDKELLKTDFSVYERTDIFIGGTNEENSK